MKIVHSQLIGHFNHSNFSFNPGPLRYVFNNHAMHIPHHACEIPCNGKYGVNSGIPLSLWDYLFGTVVVPRDGRDVKPGFPGLEKFPGISFRKYLMVSNDTGNEYIETNEREFVDMAP